MNNETGEVVLNSQVAHICARSEGGPRWNPEMTEDENRAESNLIPLCLEHAYEIDATPERYSVALLNDWKRRQIAEHFEMQKGWPLTDAEAKEIVDASFNASEFGANIVGASVLHRRRERLATWLRPLVSSVTPLNPASACQSCGPRTAVDASHVAPPTGAPFIRRTR